MLKLVQTYREGSDFPDSNWLVDEALWAAASAGLPERPDHAQVEQALLKSGVCLAAESAVTYY